MIYCNFFFYFVSLFSFLFCCKNELCPTDAKSSFVSCQQKCCQNRIILASKMNKKAETERKNEPWFLTIEFVTENKKYIHSLWTFFCSINFLFLVRDKIILNVLLKILFHCSKNSNNVSKQRLLLFQAKNMQSSDSFLFHSRMSLLSSLSLSLSFIAAAADMPAIVENNKKMHWLTLTSALKNTPLLWQRERRREWRP